MSPKKQTNRIAASLILLILPLLLIICSFYGSDQASYVKLYTQGKSRLLVQKERLSDPDSSRRLAPIAAYAAGMACYAEDYFKSATKLLALAAESDTQLADHALYHCGRAAAQSGQISTALRSFLKVVNNHPKSVFYKNALYKSIRITTKNRAWAPAKKLLKKALKISSGWRKQRYNLQLAKIYIRYNQTKPAVSLLKQILKNNRYPSLMANAWRTLTQRTEYLPQTIFEKLLLARGAISANRTQKALKTLYLIRKTTRNQTIYLESSLDIVWASKKRRRWNQAKKILSKLEKKFKHSPAMLERILKHQFKLALTLRKVGKALILAQKINHLNNNKNASLFLRISKRSYKGGRFFWRCNLTALKLFPSYYSFQDNLLLCLAHSFSKKHYRSVLNKGPLLASKATHNQIKAGAYYFMYRAAKRLGYSSRAKKYAALTIQAEPLGHYHNLVPNLIANNPKQTEYSKIKNSSQLCKYYFTASKSNKKRIIQRLKKMSQLPRELFLTGFNLSGMPSFPQLNSYASQKVHFFIRNGLYRDAYNEIRRRIAQKRQKYKMLSTTQLAQLAKLAAAGNLHSSEIYIYRILLHKLRWDKEIIVLEKIYGNTILKKLYPRHFQQDIKKVANKYTLDPLFILSLIRQESSFNPSIHSWAGAIGLMQLMPSTAAGIAARLKIEYADLHNPQTNIKIGCSFLKWLKKTYKKNEYALIGYNAGPNRIRQWKRRFQRRYRHFDLAAFCELIPFNETRGYIKRVQSNLSVYQSLY